MLAEMPIGDYLTELCQGVVIGLKPDGFQLALEVVCGTQKFDLDTSIPLGLMVNELMTNSLKHAFTNRSNGKISLRLTKVEDQSFELLYADDGVGMPKNVKLEGNESLGLKLVQILAQQLNGDISYTYQNGAQFKLRFKA
jgi:two-component sensor histidine kinase